MASLLYAIGSPRAFEAVLANRELLPPTIYNYFAAGAGEGLTLAANRTAFARVALRPRVLTGVGPPELATTVRFKGSFAAFFLIFNNHLIGVRSILE